MQTILAIDLGTSAVKLSFFDPSLRCLASHSEAYSSFYPMPDAVEQRPEDWWSAIRRGLQALRQQDPAYAQACLGIGLSAQMLGLIPCTAEGEALAPCLIHADLRAKKQCQEIEEKIGKEAFYRLTGNVLSPALPLCKVLWFKQERPELYAQSTLFLGPKDYLVARLTGGQIATDYSDASHAGLLALEMRTYATDLFKSLGLSASTFPPLSLSHRQLGTVPEVVATDLGLPKDCPVFLGGGDGACANAGAGLSLQSPIYCSLGTTAWLALEQDSPYFDPEERVFNICSLAPNRVGIFGTMQTAGRAIEWAKSLFSIESLAKFDALASEAEPGSDGLVFLPYLEGERSPIFDSDAKALFFGASSRHETKHFLRAVLEGIAFALDSILDCLPVPEQVPIRLIGGGAKSEILVEILADVWQRPVELLDLPASTLTALGAAMAVAIGLGQFASYQEASASLRVLRTQMPNPDRAKAYERNRLLYRKLYPAIKDLYQL